MSAHGVDDCGVDLHGSDLGGFGGQRGEHVPSAAGADDEGLGPVDHMIGEGRQIVSQERNLVQIAVELLDWRTGNGVDQQQRMGVGGALGERPLPVRR